ncbi:MAG: hypothetical protein N2053_12540, partial [Chitinispirillaceae bacterium]|nr:hypothetical protein [Chitinispirillaceae bacterium]
MYKNSREKFYTFILFLFFYVSGNVIVTESTKERLTFTWSLSQIDTISFLSGEDRVTSISFKYSNTFTGEDGEIVLPGYSLNVGVPYEGEISVEFTPLEFKTIRLNYPPFKSKEIREEEDRTPVNFYNRWVSSPSYFFLRSQRVANIIIRPVSYDDVSGNLIYITKAIGTIRFPKSNYRLLAFSRYNEFESMLKSLLLNYDIAMGWREMNRLYKRKVSEPFPISFDKKVFYFRIGDGFEGFNEATINENGLVKIEGKKIRELFGEIGIKKVKLYASLKGVLPIQLKSNSGIPSGVKEIPLLRVDKNGNGIVDNEDYFLAYVTGASDWEQDTYYGYGKMEVDPYDDYRTYWLTTSMEDGLTIGVGEKIEASWDKDYDRYTERIQFQRSLLPTDDKNDRDFVWKVLSNAQPHFEYKLSLPGIVAVDSGRFFVMGEKRGVDINIMLGGKEVCTSCDLNNSYPITE